MTLLFYFTSEQILGVEPFTFVEVLEWVNSKDQPTKTALLGSLITIVGFLLAYATATANWKDQMRASLKLQAARDIEVFFSECSRLITDCNIYVSGFVNTLNEIQNGVNTDKALFLVRYHRDQAKLFFQKKQRINELSMRFIHLWAVTAHYYLLAQDYNQA